MPAQYMISIMSSDRVGMVADITAAIQKLHGNLEDLSQTVMQGYFTMILLAEFPEGTEGSGVRQTLLNVKSLAGCEIGVMPFDRSVKANALPKSDDDLYVLTVSGPDDKGLVASISEYLSIKNINIEDLCTRIENGQYMMFFLVRLPAGTDVAQLKKSMRIATEERHLEIEIRQQALFSKTNEI